MFMSSSRRLGALCLLFHLAALAEAKLSLHLRRGQGPSTPAGAEQGGRDSPYIDFEEHDRARMLANAHSGSIQGGRPGTFYQ